jgi:hypothetical protein
LFIYINYFIGKSILATQIAAYLRGQGKIVLICCSTTLACQNFRGAITPHSLFDYPVIDNNDDIDEKICCRFDKNKNRNDLLMNTDIIIWDECFGNNRLLIEAVLNAMKHNRKIVWLFIGDTRQILPIVKWGTPHDIICANLTSSRLWKSFTIYFLTENKRLTTVRTLQMSDTMYFEFCSKQIEFSKMLLIFGEGNSTNDMNHICNYIGNVDTEYKMERISKYELPNTKYYNHNETEEIKSAIEWMFPNNDVTNPAYNISRVILAITNNRVDFWNDYIQGYNPSELITLYSTDYFAEVDDDNGNLNNLLTHKVSDALSNSQIPQHCLKLKINDICLIMRPMKVFDLATNERVRIHKITNKIVTIETLDSNRRKICIPRIRFNYLPTENTSYKMVRIQFPLRLCYAMTINKSQGQSLDQVLLDITEDSFSHGQTYVAWSRVRSFDALRLIVNEKNLIEIDGKSIPIILNYLYPSVILKPPLTTNVLLPINDVIDYDSDSNSFESESTNSLDAEENNSFISNEETYSFISNDSTLEDLSNNGNEIDNFDSDSDDDELNDNLISVY